MKPSLSRGSVLVYLVVLILLFGVLGVIITSLFTISTFSSATPNQVRRAFYVTESAMRYASSELRNSDFDTGVINTLNTTTYNVNPEGNFTFNIFGPWFEANETKDIPGAGGTLDLRVPEGKLTADWMNKNPSGLWLVNYDYMDLDLSTARDPIASWVKTGDTTMTITVGGDLIVNSGEQVCLAVKPFGDPAAFGDGGSLDVQIEAKDFFPQRDGAINIDRFDYVYKKMVVESDRVRLEGISASSMPNSESPPSSLDLSPDDFIVLSPRNHIIIPTATADTVTVEGTLDNALNIYDLATVKPMTSSPDIDFNQEATLSDVLNQKETHTGFINIDDVNKTIDVGGGSGIAADPEFGSVWFDADMSIGGKQGVCAAGACELGRGVRVFFTLDYDGVADGLTFALINAAHNTAASSGGDVAMGELLGYGGDSRKINIPASATVNTTDFLDGSGAGLRPPKIALEFDTFTNNDTLNFCQGTSKVNSNRNDPFNSNRDAVQQIFWGLTSLAMPCRDYTLSGTPVNDHPSYDDNQHDSGELEQPWTPYQTSGAVRSTPAVAADGTIYVGSDDGHLYAINPDGSLKWKSIPIGQVKSSPAIGPDGFVYVGTNNSWVYGFEKDSGTLEYSFAGSGIFQSSPVIGAGGEVYIGSEDNKFYGLTPTPGSPPELIKDWEFQADGPISFGRPALSPGGIIYLSHRADSTTTSKVYALDPVERKNGETFPVTGKEWAFVIADGAHYMPGIDPTTGTIYSDASSSRIVAITPAGVLDWEFNLGSDIDSTPVVGSDGTVYFGADNGNLYAINPVQRKLYPSGGGFTSGSNNEWNFAVPTGPLDNMPAIAPDGTILVVSDDDTLYAVNPDGTEKWTFPIPVDANEPTSSPTVGNQGVVYVGSSDNKLYAINNFAEPRNFKDKVVTAVNDGSDITVAGEIVTVDSELNWLNGDSSTPKGPWAVRLEVMRSLTQNANSKYEYTLHFWIRQCDSVACGNILGTFYEDTRIEYAATPHLAQTIELDSTQHTDFTRFLFGFTGATGSGTYQSAVIADLKLSFIRANDPIAGD